MNPAVTGAIDLRRATAFAGTQHGSGQSSGRTNYVADDIVGAGTATLALSATAPVLRIERAFSTGNTADLSWYVVEWGRADET